MNDEFDDILGGPAPEPEKAEPEKKGPSRSKKEPTPKAEKRRKIIIDEVEGQPNYEIVGVNGTIYQIRRGEEMEVPESVVEVLRNAIASKYVTVKRSDGFEDLQKRNLSSIPWRLVG